jgi:hypothetical protein
MNERKVTMKASIFPIFSVLVLITVAAPPAQAARPAKKTATTKRAAQYVFRAVHDKFSGQGPDLSSPENRVKAQWRIHEPQELMKAFRRGGPGEFAEAWAQLNPDNADPKVKRSIIALHEPSTELPFQDAMSEPELQRSGKLILATGTMSAIKKILPTFPGYKGSPARVQILRATDSAEALRALISWPFFSRDQLGDPNAPKDISNPSRLDFYADLISTFPVDKRSRVAHLVDQLEYLIGGTRDESREESAASAE